MALTLMTLMTFHRLRVLIQHPSARVGVLHAAGTLRKLHGALWMLAMRPWMTCSHEEEDVEPLEPTPGKHAAKSAQPDDATCTT